MKIIIFILLLTTFESGYSQKKYLLHSNPLLIEISRDSAFSQVWESENSVKRERVKDYLKAVGLNQNAPYCAAGVYWSFWVAAKALNICTLEIPINRTAVANEMFNYAQRKGRLVRYSADIDDFLVWRLPGSYRGHIERIVANGKSGWVTTIGFNTKSNNNPKIYGVFFKKRNIYHPIGRLKIRGLIGFKNES